MKNAMDASYALSRSLEVNVSKKINLLPTT